MTVYLGHNGTIELTRTSLDMRVESTITPADISTARNRFSTDVIISTLITGDLVVFASTDDQPLAFISSSAWVDNTVHSDGKFYVNVDEAGGIRLYTTFDYAVNGGATGLIPLVNIEDSLTLTYYVENVAPRIIGQLTSWEFNTSKATVDVTAIGDQYQEMYGTVISGNGRMEALFEYELSESDPLYPSTGTGNAETPYYLYSLLQRHNLGSTFKAKLSLVQVGFGHGPKDEVFYDISGVITNCGVSVAAGSVITSSFEFITTGPFSLKLGSAVTHILQEDGLSKLKLEAAQGYGFLSTEEET